MKKLNLAICLLAVSALFFSACKKNNSDTGGSNNANAKITITVSKEFLKAEGDYLDVNVSGADLNSKFIDWKVNGVTKSGTVVTVGTDDFNGGKTIVLESDRNFFSGNFSIGGFEFGATPFTVTYKVEVNGKVVFQGTEKIIKDRSPVFSTGVQLRAD